MENVNPITQELKDLGSMLGKYPPVNPYNVPVGYFAGFPDQMLSIIAEHDLPASLLNLQTPYNVPAGYFENLPGLILNKTRETADSEIASLSPLLSGLSRKMPLSVPDNYFDILAGNVVSGTQAIDLSKPAPAKVVKGSFNRRVLQYAAAAVITGLTITAGYFIINKNNQDQQIVSVNSLREKAAQTTDEEILNYLENLPLPIGDSSLNNTAPEIGNDAILDMLADVSDEELQQYLQTQSDTKLLIN